MGIADTAQALNSFFNNQNSVAASNLAEDKFAFDKGADQRKLFAAENERRRVNQEGILTNEVLGNSGWSQIDNLNEDKQIQASLANHSEYSKLPPAEQQAMFNAKKEELRTKHPSMRKIFSNKDVYMQNTVSDLLAKNNQMSRANAIAAAQGEYTKMWGGLDPTIGTALINAQKPNAVTNNYSGGYDGGSAPGKGNYKLFQGQLPQGEELNSLKQFASTLGMPDKQAWEIFGRRFDLFNNDQTQADFVKAVGALTGGPDGVPAYNAAWALSQQVSSGGQTPSGLKFHNLTPEQITSLKAKARGFQNTSERMYDSKNDPRSVDGQLRLQQQQQAQYGQNVSNILSAMSPGNSTKEAQRNAFLSLFGIEPKKTVTNTGSGKSKTKTVAKTPEELKQEFIAKESGNPGLQNFTNKILSDNPQGGPSVGNANTTQQNASASFTPKMSSELEELESIANALPENLEYAGIGDGQDNVPELTAKQKARYDQLRKMKADSDKQIFAERSPYMASVQAERERLAQSQSVFDRTVDNRRAQTAQTVADQGIPLPRMPAPVPNQQAIPKQMGPGSSAEQVLRLFEPQGNPYAPGQPPMPRSLDQITTAGQPRSLGEVLAARSNPAYSGGGDPMKGLQVGVPSASRTPPTNTPAQVQKILQGANNQVDQRILPDTVVNGVQDNTPVAKMNDRQLATQKMNIFEQLESNPNLSAAERAKLIKRLAAIKTAQGN